MNTGLQKLSALFQDTATFVRHCGLNALAFGPMPSEEIRDQMNKNGWHIEAIVRQCADTKYCIVNPQGESVSFLSHEYLAAIREAHQQRKAAFKAAFNDAVRLPELLNDLYTFARFCGPRSLFYGPVPNEAIRNQMAKMGWKVEVTGRLDTTWTDIIDPQGEDRFCFHHRYLAAIREAHRELKNPPAAMTLNA